MKKNKISKNWLIKKNKDPFFKLSKIQGYRSRSAIKLIEMNNKFKFLKKNSSLLDLGSCQGGCSQVARKILVSDGVFLSKLFMGSIFKEINEKAKNTFKNVVRYKPLSSKKESKEIYFFCKGILKI